MPKRFTKDSLPEALRNMVNYLIWNDGDFDDKYLGQVDLKDEYQFEDGSHITLFKSKSDLVRILKEVSK